MAIDLTATAEGVMDAIVTRLVEAEVDVPSFRYVTGANQIAFDCESLIVHASQVYVGQPGLQQPGPYYDTSLFNVDLGVSLIRCLNVELPLSDRQLIDQGTAALDDASALLKAALDAHDQGQLITACDLMQIGPITWQGPAGGLLGVTLSIAARVA